MKLRAHVLAFAFMVSGAAAAVAQQPAQAGSTTQTPASGAAHTTHAKADEKLPSIEEIFAKYTQALGGREAINKYKSRVQTGSVELAPMNARGSVEVSQKAPNRMLMVMKLAGLGEFRQGYDGSTGWANDPFQGLRELSGGELAATQRSAIFDASERNALYKKRTVTGKSKVGERDVYVVEAVHTEGSDPDKMYFDVESGLILRTDSTVDGPQGRVVAESYMEDYRAVDGILIPHTVRQVVGAVTIIQRLESIKHDVSLDDALFKKPSAQ